MSKIKSAEEYLDENYFGLTIDCKRDIGEIQQALEEYADYVLKSKLESITDEVIEKQFNTSPNNHIHPDRYRTEGAKWLKQKLLKDE